MEGLTTFPMRLWLHMLSEPEIMTTPFLKATRVYPEDEIPLDFVPELLHLRGHFPYQITPQFISGDPDHFLRAAELFPEALTPFVELNCGCPSPNSMGRLAGSGMLADPLYFAREMERLCSRLGPGRLAIKMRLGTEEASEFPLLLEGLKGLPLARLTVHGRTRKEAYRGRANWDAIEQAAKTLALPITASGDVWGLESYRRLLTEAPSIHSVMIGRGLMRNPWIYREIREGREQKLSQDTFFSSLFAYALFHHLWQLEPETLIRRIEQGRIGKVCALEDEAWEKEIVELTKLVFGFPFLITQKGKVESEKISPVAFSRLKLLWGYLKTSLPEAFADPKIQRSRSLGEFFERIAHRNEGRDIPLAHNPSWDKIFNKTG